MNQRNRWFYWEGDQLHLSLRVQPRASQDQWVGPQQEYCRVRITAPPVDGKANAHLIRFLAKSFGVPRASVRLISGDSGRIKRLVIDNPTRFPSAEMDDRCPAPRT
ncbi:MAG: YggU family protein [Gammaproteobacteria bacterium]|nr:YggU family protein [Gammaproteobacteria bacterium]